MKDHTNMVEVHLPNELGYEKIAMEAAAATAKMLGFSPDRVDDLRTAVSEACINAIEHGPKQQRTERLLITLKAGEGELQVEVHDTGDPYTIPHKRPNLKRKMEGGSPPRGWGLFLIRNLVDKFEVAASEGGNVTRMIITLHKS